MPSYLGWESQSAESRKGSSAGNKTYLDDVLHACRVVAVVEYTVNQTYSIYLDPEATVEYIITLIEGNVNVFEEIYTMKSVKSGTVLYIANIMDSCSILTIVTPEGWLV